MTAATLVRTQSAAVPTRARRRPRSGRARWLAIVPGLVFVLVPIYWMVSSALKSNPELGLLSPTLYPHQPTLDQFRAALVCPAVNRRR